MTKRRILLVDDEASLTRMLRRNLEATGMYEVQEENDGRNAVNAARQFMPDLILLDVMMPGTDGGDVSAQLGDDPRLKDIPIVFLTAIVSCEEVGSTGRTIGGKTFLAKPVKLEGLLTCIEDHLK